MFGSAVRFSEHDTVKKSKTMNVNVSMLTCHSFFGHHSSPC